MARNALLRLKTGLLRAEDEPSNPINPLHGEALLRWLSAHWRASTSLTEPQPEDWGWYAYVTWEARVYLLGAHCYDPEDGVREWQLAVEKQRTLTERLFGREEMVESDGCVAEVRRLLEAEAAFRDISLEWN